YRRTGQIAAGGFTLDLKPVDANAPSYPRHNLAELLLLGEGERPVAYIDP
ncbi:MAG: hypothetical protein GY906_14975, partial [bacterium]|nr:hypothetical protein [bacterium]